MIACAAPGADTKVELPVLCVYVCVYVRVCVCVCVLVCVALQS